MSDKQSAYGTPVSDTSFRRTWNREEYARQAAEEKAKKKEEGRLRYEAKLQGKKYHAPVDWSSLDTTKERSQRLDVASLVGKTSMVPATATTGKRGRGAGFYCADCDLTFKDNIQFVEHLNSKQHLVATGQSGEVKKASLEEVRLRLRYLAHKQRETEEEERLLGQLDLGERLKTRAEEETKEREAKKRKRNERRRKGNQEDAWEDRLGIIA